MTEHEIRELCRRIPPAAEGKPQDSMTYFSASQFKRFCDCEARALAILRKEWTEKTTEALVFGKYFHAYFEGPEAFEKIQVEHQPEIFTQKGLLRAEFARARAMFDKVEADPKAMKFVEGLHEVEILGEIDGVPWRGRIDVLHLLSSMFVDLKAVADIYAGEWLLKIDDNGFKRNQKVSFIESYGYWRQMAVYEELLRQKFGTRFVPVMLAVSKQEPPDIELIGFTNHKGSTSRLETELDEVKARQQHFLRVKSGEEQPVMCGYCDYCRSRKRIRKMITPSDLEVLIK